MQHFLIRRGFYVVLMLVLVSIVGFVVINLPPGDFMDAYLARMQSSGTEVDKEMADNLRKNYGLDKPLYVQYLIWFFGVVRGDFGWSFDHQIPVSDLVKERIALTLVISLCTMVFVYAAAILGETSLSFLGLGLQRPVLSWGVLLQNAQNVRTMAVFPWMMTPVLFVIAAVLLFNFVGDGLRDAADPYKR